MKAMVAITLKKEKRYNTGQNVFEFYTHHKFFLKMIA